MNLSSRPAAKHAIRSQAERGKSRPAARAYADPSQEGNTDTATRSNLLRAGTSRAPVVVPRCALEL